MNNKQKDAAMTKLISDQINFKKKFYSRKKDTLLIKRSTDQQDKTIIAIYETNSRGPKYMKQNWT